MKKRTVVIGMLGTTLDAGKGPKRWERWRPTIALCQHEDFVVHRLDLLYQRRAEGLCRTIQADLAEVSPETEVRTHQVEFEDPWDLEQVYGALHDFARAYPFQTAKEDYLIHITTGTHIHQICTFLLTEARYFPARLLQTSPPPPHDPQSPGTYRIFDLDLSKYDRIARRFDKERTLGLAFLKSGIETRNKAFNAMIDQIERVAITARDPILLTGPTGAGKSQLARRIFELKQTRQKVEGAFVDVNCATIRGDGAMSALFGHVKGAFTGAQSARQGHLKQSDGGVLFLDEIGELGPDEQAMLLRAIEEGIFYPVGSDHEVRSDFQLIAGTNRDLRSEVAAGRFREDLLARINLWTYRLPGLAERPEDIPPNLDYELERVGRALNLNVTMSREAREDFERFGCGPTARWSGNFRDLNAAVRRMATLCSGGRISREDVQQEVARLEDSWRSAANDAPGFAALDAVLGEATGDLDLFDRVQLNTVLQVCRTSRNLSDAGRALFAASRKKKATSNDADRLRKYLARFGLSWDEVKLSSTHPAQSS